MIRGQDGGGPSTVCVCLFFELVSLSCSWSAPSGKPLSPQQPLALVVLECDRLTCVSASVVCRPTSAAAATHTPPGPQGSKAAQHKPDTSTAKHSTADCHCSAAGPLLEAPFSPLRSGHLVVNLPEFNDLQLVFFSLSLSLSRSPSAAEFLLHPPGSGKKRAAKRRWAIGGRPLPLFALGLCLCLCLWRRPTSSANCSPIGGAANWGRRQLGFRLPLSRPFVVRRRPSPAARRPPLPPITRNRFPPTVDELTQSPRAASSLQPSASPAG